MKNDVRYYRIAGITIRVDSDIPFGPRTFDRKFRAFEADGPGEDTISILHRFFLPSLDRKRLGRELYRRPPWAIFDLGDSWLYLGVTSDSDSEGLHKVAVFSKDYARGTIYHPDDSAFRRGNSHALTFFPTDQILVAQLLASRAACYLHSSGVSFKGRVLLFMGHSEAGKSTMVKMLKGRAEILCDDRMIIRKGPEGLLVHGTWSHGEVPDVSSSSAPLTAIFFLRKSAENRLVPVTGKQGVVSGLLSCLIKPHVTVGWWENMLGLVEDIASRVPCRELLFDRSGKIADVLDDFVTGLEPLEVTLYGMTPEAYEALSRAPGSFDAAMAGIGLLRDRKVPFIVKGAFLPAVGGDLASFEKWTKAVLGMDRPPSVSAFYVLHAREDRAVRLSQGALQHLSVRGEQLRNSLRSADATILGPTTALS